MSYGRSEVDPGQDITDITNYYQVLHPRMYTNTIQDDCYDNVLVHPAVKKDHDLVPSVAIGAPEFYFEENMDRKSMDRKSISDHRAIKVIFYNM